MVSEKARRRAEFQGGAPVKMADGQEWAFANPPAAGVDAEYDALLQGLLEAEDRNEARKFELAIGMLLLSRNYQPSPREYREIFCFDSDDAGRSAAQEAISTLIGSNLERRRREVVAGKPVSGALRPHLRTLPAFISTCATHLRSTLTPRLR